MASESTNEGPVSKESEAGTERKDISSEQPQAAGETKGAASDTTEAAGETMKMKKGSVCGAHGQQRQVTIAVDASDKSLEAVSWAAQNLVHPGDAVTLLHAQPKPDLHGGVLPLKDEPLNEEALESLRTHISSLTRRTLERAKEACCKAQEVDAETVAVIGDARDVICKYVDEHHCDMLVVGSRGLGGIKSQLLGSVSAHCVHHAHVPVVVVRTH